ncbi:hypothetical protein MSAN_01003900 [Mycena sanguinolenta]|uniref:Transcription initiation factor TFIID subunit 13 n=1 Tax=Mycena sanguinolenta TaxID=230812 RepID=A0A8H6YLV1_9AGAR|nr:hypothetical protein MSAN_01003900 [Mycena sanguinolenta]
MRTVEVVTCKPPGSKGEAAQTSEPLGTSTKRGSDTPKSKRKRVERSSDAGDDDSEAAPPCKKKAARADASRKTSKDTKRGGGSDAPKSKRKKTEQKGDDEEPAPSPRKRKITKKLVESSSEDEAPVRRKRITRSPKKKTRRSHSSDDESCSGDEVDSEHIIESRLRKPKVSRRDFLLENIKRKKRGLPPLESPPDTSESDDDDSESSWDSLFDEDSDRSSVFIVEDDCSTVSAALPKEFSMVAYEGLSQQFKKIFQFMVHLAVRPQLEREKFMTELLKTEEYFSIPLQAARRRISSIRDSLASLRWKPEYTELLAKYPELKIEDISRKAKEPVCDVCNNQGRKGSKVGKLSGVPYNRTGFGEIDDEFWDDDSSKKGRKKDSKRSKKDKKEFYVGRFCAERTQVFHKICHWEYELFKSISQEVDQLQEMKQSSGVFDDRDVFVPIKKLDVDVEDPDAIYEWLEKRSRIEMEWQKIKTILDQAQQPRCRSSRNSNSSPTPPHATPAPAPAAGAHTPSTPAPVPVTAAYPYSAYPSAYAPHTPYTQIQGAYPYQATAPSPYQYANWNATETCFGCGSDDRDRDDDSADKHPDPARATPTFSSYTPPAASSSTSQARESATVAAASTGGATGRGARKQQANVRGLFTKELKTLMYGFGDDRNPATDTVNVMEEILIEYITDVCQTAGTQSKRVRLSIEDLRRVLSRPPDAKKLARMEELLFMQEDIKRARARSFRKTCPKNTFPKSFRIQIEIKLQLRSRAVKIARMPI